MTPEEVLKINPANIVRDATDGAALAARRAARAELATLSPEEVLRRHKAGELDHLIKPGQEN
jgi:hypothetical protein